VLYFTIYYYSCRHRLIASASAPVAHALNTGSQKRTIAQTKQGMQHALFPQLK